MGMGVHLLFSLYRRPRCVRPGPTEYPRMDTNDPWQLSTLASPVFVYAAIYQVFRCHSVACAAGALAVAISDYPPADGLLTLIANWPDGPAHGLRAGPDHLLGRRKGPPVSGRG